MGGLAMFDYAGSFQNNFDKARKEKQQNGLAQLAANYAQGGQPDFQGIAANGGDPLAFRNDAQNQKQARVKELSQYAGYLASLPEQARPQAYAALMPKLAPIGQELGLPPLPAAWDESHLEELQALAQLGMGPQESPAGMQEFNALTRGLSPEDRQKAQRVKLGLDGRAPSGLPFGFMEVVGSDGVTRIIQTNKAQGGAAMIGPGGQPYGAGSAAPPQGTNANVLEVANQMAAAGIPPQYIEQWMAKQPGIGPPPGAPVQAASGANPFESRSPEAQARLTTGATEQAKIDAQVGNAPRIAQSEAQVAAAKALAEARAKSQGERDAKISQRTQNAGTALDLLGEAEKLLPGATGSTLGSVRDSGAAVFGKSTPGAQNAAQLKTIAGQLILMQPRMEGPQSDADRKLYAAMAGDLGDETKPVETRMAALKGMQRLQTKYANKQPAAKGWSIQKVE